MTIPPRAVGRIQVRFPTLEPGYLVDVIGLRRPASSTALIPATSQPAYPADRCPRRRWSPATCPTRSAARPPGTSRRRAAGLLGVAYPALDPETGCAEDAGERPAPRLRPACPTWPSAACCGSGTTAPAWTASLPVTGCAPIARLFNDRCVTCGTSPRGRIADLTLASFIALGGELERGCFNATITIGDDRAVLRAIREVQIPLLAAMLLGGCAAKLARIAADRLGGRRPRARRRCSRCGCAGRWRSRLCAVEFGLGLGLIVTAGPVGRGAPATCIRLGTGLLFLVATSALIELRTARPDVGCGCFGDFSTAPVSGRTLARSALLAIAALATIGLPPVVAPKTAGDGFGCSGSSAPSCSLIAALSPELGEALVRLGYSEPCELRDVPSARTLPALRRQQAMAQVRGP